MLSSWGIYERMTNQLQEIDGQLCPVEYVRIEGFDSEEEAELAYDQLVQFYGGTLFVQETLGP